MHLNAEQVNSLLRTDLFEAGWDGSEVAYPGQTKRQFAMMSLNNSFLKKFHNEETDDIRDEQALHLFLECNKRCASLNYASQLDSFSELVLGEMKSIIYDFFNPAPGFVAVAKVDDFTLFRDREPLLLNLSDIATRFGFGSGSNIGSNSTDSYTKYCNSTMAHTGHELLVLYRHAISGETLLKDSEEFRQKAYGSEVVTGNKLSFVPKSAKISRTICTEPLLNMLFQKGIGKLLEERLDEFFGINIHSQQEVNAGMARIGSQTGEFGTIDLSSASDTIATSLVRDLLPPEAFNWLMRCRSPLTVLPDGTEVELHMISSMGNGFTFPLQTMIFASLVTAVYRCLSIPVLKCRQRQHGNFSVFGDDIIVDFRAYNLVVRCLELLGFSVNRDKSYNLGLFRESCGHDYIDGYNVRGVYLQVLKTPGDFYSAINRLNFWSAYHRIPLHACVSSLALCTRFLGVPFDEGADAGIKVPLNAYPRKRCDRNGSVKYYALKPVVRRAPVPEVSACSSVDPVALAETEKYLSHFKYCEAGVLLSLLAGWLRNGALGLRSVRPKTVLKRLICPGWDSGIPSYVENRTFREEWKYLTDFNLNGPL